MEIDRTELIYTRTHCMDLKSDEKIVHSLDFSGTIIDVSPGWLKITGYEKHEVIGKHFVEFLDMESLLKVQKNFPCLKDYGYVNNSALKIVCKNHVIISVHLTGTSKYTTDGIFERTFCEMVVVN